MEKDNLEASAQKILGKSWIHWNKGKRMTIIENNTPGNNSRFYVSEDGDYKEIPYVAQILGFDPENFYQGFEKIN